MWRTVRGTHTARTMLVVTGVHGQPPVVNMENQVLP